MTTFDGHSHTFLSLQYEDTSESQNCSYVFNSSVCEDGYWMRAPEAVSIEGSKTYIRVEKMASGNRDMTEKETDTILGLTCRGG